MPDLASAASEMTTVHTYLYQSWTIGNDYETIRCVIKRLAAVEQHHYAIIGQLIALLGGEPECRSTMNNSYWCGNMINYSCDLRTLLSNNAKSEVFCRSGICRTVAGNQGSLRFKNARAPVA